MKSNRIPILVFILILASTALDVISTNLGVVILGNEEASPVARYVISAFSSNWWIVYFPYEFGALLLAFFVLKTTRLVLSHQFQQSRVLGLLKIEYAVILVSYFADINNALLLLSRMGRL